MDLREDNGFLQTVIATHEHEVEQRQEAIDTEYDEAALAKLRAEIAGRTPRELMRDVLQGAYTGSCLDNDQEGAVTVTVVGECPLELPDSETKLGSELMWRTGLRVPANQPELQDVARRQLRNGQEPVDLYLHTLDLQGHVWPHYIATLEPDGSFSFPDELVEGGPLDDAARQDRQEVATQALREASLAQVLDQAAYHLYADA